MRKYVVSASRRTDMLACQPERLVGALRGELRYARQLRPDRIHTLLISTKDYRNILDCDEVRETCKSCDQVCFNLTITGLGGTEIEPGVPQAGLLAERLPELVAFVGDPRRITWCFDPIIACETATNMSSELFASIAEPVRRAGVTRVMAMFYRPYRQSRISPRIPAPKERLRFASYLQTIASNLGMELSVCHMQGMHRTKCVDLEWLSDLHPYRDKSPLKFYAKAQRCGGHACRDAIWDIGWYLPACRMGCVYCYGQSIKHTNPATPCSFPLENA